VTEFVEPVGGGKARLEFGFEFLQDAVFRLSGLKGDLTRLGVLGLRFGAGEAVEFQLVWPVRNFLNIHERFPSPIEDDLDFAGNSTSDFGDLLLATKFRVRPERGKMPSFGFRFGVQLPNASTEKGLGTDTLGFLTGVLVEKTLGRTKILGNAGLTILGDPLSAGSQDDLFAYGLALVHGVSERLHLFGDIYGRAGAGGIGTEEQARVRIGAQIKAGGLYWDAAFQGGFLDTDPKTGIIFGVSKELRFGLVQ
jgi:hypothetical protein